MESAGTSLPSQLVGLWSPHSQPQQEAESPKVDFDTGVLMSTLREGWYNRQLLQCIVGSQPHF